MNYQAEIKKVSKVCYPQWHYDKGKLYYGVVTDFGVVGSTRKKGREWKIAYEFLVKLGKIKHTQTT